MDFNRRVGTSMQLTLIQMSGVPGSGKSTIARAIAPSLDAIVLDHDDTKSAILSIGVEGDLAGQASYSVIRVLARRYLSEGRNVIVDSPCLYQPLLDFGLGLALEFGAEYQYIECQLDDLDVLDDRLQQRDTRPSQLGSLTEPIRHRGGAPREPRQLVNEWASNMKRPNSSFLILDSSQSIEVNVAKALAHIHSDR